MTHSSLFSPAPPWQLEELHELMPRNFAAEFGSDSAANEFITSASQTKIPPKNLVFVKRFNEGKSLLGTRGLLNNPPPECNPLSTNFRLFSGRTLAFPSVFFWLECCRRNCSCCFTPHCAPLISSASSDAFPASISSCRSRPPPRNSSRSNKAKPFGTASVNFKSRRR